MSEYQNNAVAVLSESFGVLSLSNAEETRVRFLLAAIELFHAAEGSQATALKVVSDIFKKNRGQVHVKIGESMMGLAGIAFANDLDMIQAGYNTLDQEWNLLNNLKKTRSGRKIP